MKNLINNGEFNNFAYIAGVIILFAIIYAFKQIFL
jgi:hypothetical protein